MRNVSDAGPLPCVVHDLYHGGAFPPVGLPLPPVAQKTCQPVSAMPPPIPQTPRPPSRLLRTPGMRTPARRSMCVTPSLRLSDEECERTEELYATMEQLADVRRQCTVYQQTFH